MKEEGKKFIPYEKLSKRERRKLDLMRRGSWQGVVPTLRKVESGKRYKRHEKHKNSFAGEL